jgi:conjugal transfer pilus assembly protein TraV
MRILTILFSFCFLISCSAKYACKDKVNLEGEKCDPITEVYEKKVIGSEPHKREKVKKEKKEEVISEDVEVVRGLSYEEGKPLRLPPRVIRIWIAPWEDSDGDLHQPSYIYSEISPKRGRWLFGEKETITTQPALRPMEKPASEFKVESEKGESIKKEEPKRKEEKKEESKRKEEQKKKENEPWSRKGKEGEREPLRLPFKSLE